MITKEDIIKAFNSKRNTARRKMIAYYYQELFNLPIPATMLAEKISTDLGIPISAEFIHSTRHSTKAKSVHDYNRQSKTMSAKSFSTDQIPDVSYSSEPLIQFVKSS